MKKIILIFFLHLCLFGHLFGQATFEGNLQNIPQNRYLGYSNNFSLATRTSGIDRVKLNHNIAYNVGPYAGGRNGYMLLGYSQTYAAPLFTPGVGGAFSQLHLNGPNGTFVQAEGYRPWMQTGITFTDNNDLSYFGLRRLGTAPDITETALVWSDNGLSGGGFGPDQMVFRFTTVGDGTTNYATNYSNQTNGGFNSPFDFDGVHVARFTGTGLMGIGSTFGVVVAGTPDYVQPQSHVHVSHDYRSNDAHTGFGFMQVTYKNMDIAPYSLGYLGTNNIGSGETAGDGLRIGIDNETISQEGEVLNSYFRWQENSSMIFQTDWNNTANEGQMNAGQGERLRITSVGALAQNASSIYLGLTAPANRTRVSISHDGNNPVNRPMSLLHLGYDLSTVPLFGNTTADGWRNWMDVGTFTSVGSDNMYVGMKNEGTDMYDAIINWGDNQTDSTGDGPDHLRFIFTSTTTALPPGQGDSVAMSNNGLEIMRMVPIYDTTATDPWLISMNSNGDASTYGRVGIGDFTAAGVNEEPTHKLDVVGNGRFRFLPDSLYMADSTVTQIVMVDSSGVLRWASMPAGFVPCGDTTGRADLFSNSHVNLNNYNLYFETEDSLNTNDVGIGYFCGDILPGQLSVYTHTDLYAGHFLVNNADVLDPFFQGGVISIVDSIYSDSIVVIHGVATQNLNPTQHLYHVAVLGETDARNCKTAIGVEGETINGGTGGYFKSNGGGLPIGIVGVQAIVQNSSTGGTAVIAQAFGSAGNGMTGVNSVAVCNNASNPNAGVRTIAIGSGAGVINYGTHTTGSGGAGATNYGIYAVGGGTGNYAGWFVGDVWSTTGVYGGPSDENLKQNIDSLSRDSASYYINMLKPSTFEFQNIAYPQLGLPSGHQYGLIAQDVEQVLPSFITEVTQPAQYDSLGNEISAAVTYKGLDYQNFIPLLIADAQNKNQAIDSLIETVDTLETIVMQQDSLINNLNDRLTTLENCLSSILPFLCQINNDMIQQNDDETQMQLNEMLNIELTDENAIVLENNPNPFAEQTVITYSVPETVQTAQIYFYNQNGVLIKSVELPERGEGQITVYASDLSSGIYTYSLVADGIVVATKKMVKTHQ